MSGFLRMREEFFGKGHVAHVMAAVLDAPMRADPLVQRSGVAPDAEETQKTVSVVCFKMAVAGLRRQTVRFRRKTVLIRPAHGVCRNHALAGNTPSSRVSPAIASRGLALCAAARLAPRRALFQPAWPISTGNSAPSFLRA